MTRTPRACMLAKKYVPRRPGLLLLKFPPSPDPEKPTTNGTHRNLVSRGGARVTHTDLARWLVAQEVGVETEKGGSSAAVELVCKKLSHRLSRLVSARGSQAMLSRALYLARPEFPFLKVVRAGPEGCLAGLEEPLRDVGEGEADRALLMVLTSFIDLVALFIGDELTLRLVGEVWTDLPLLKPVQASKFDGQEAAS